MHACAAGRGLRWEGKLVFFIFNWEKEATFLPRVCLSVCLSVWQQNYSSSYGWKFRKRQQAISKIMGIICNQESRYFDYFSVTNIAKNMTNTRTSVLTCNHKMAPLTCRRSVLRLAWCIPLIIINLGMYRVAQQWHSFCTPSPQLCRYTILWNVKCLKSNNWKQDDFWCNNSRGNRLELAQGFSK